MLSTDFGSDNLKLKIGKKNLSCFILENGLRVIGNETIPKALGYDGKSENWLFEFLMSINRLTPIEPGLLESIGRPVAFRTKSDVGKQGLSTTVFLEALDSIVQAKIDGFLYLSELKFAKAAEEILNSLRNTNLDAEIDLTTGFTLFKQNHKEALARRMARLTLSNYPVWVKTFPDEFYELLFELRGWNWRDLNEDAEKVGIYLIDLIFTRIGGELLEVLETTFPKKKYRKRGKPEQFVENEDLNDHILAVMALIRISGMKPVIMDQLVNKSFPKKRELMIESSTVYNKPIAQKQSLFDKSLLKAMQKK